MIVFLLVLILIALVAPILIPIFLLLVVGALAAIAAAISTAISWLASNALWIVGAGLLVLVGHRLYANRESIRRASFERRLRRKKGGAR